MKKLLLIGAGLLSLCTVGLSTAKAGPDDNDYRRGGDSYRPREVYRERCDDRDYYPRRRVVVREYYSAPRYYEDDCGPRYYHRRPRVSVYLPLPPLPFVRF